MSALKELLARAKAKAEADRLAAAIPTTTNTTNTIIATAVSEAVGTANPDVHLGTDRYGKTIEWNSEQWAFIQHAISGKSAILIGAAGTGKTTTMQGAITQLLQTKHFAPMGDDSHKHLPSGTPGIVAVSYTRRAVMNLRRAMPEDLKANCITIHKLLEYQPVYFEVEDTLNGGMKKTMKFEPNRNKYNTLSPTIKTVIIDESSMVSVDLFYKIWQALPEPTEVQFIFLGDIQQLPPVFGSAILGYKMLSLPTVELVQVYRQALESPIIRLAHRILSGKGIPVAEFPEWEFPEQLKLHNWKKQISADNALLTLAAFFKKGYDEGQYIPEDDMILIPFNKSCGTDELNRHIANHIARRKGLVTYEVIAGFNKYYFTTGDKILYEKEDAMIVSIERNSTYSGKWPQAPSALLDYWGTVQVAEGETEHHIDTDSAESDQDIDIMLAGLSADDEEGRVKEASHIIKVKIVDSGQEVELKTASAINSLVLSYSLTVHKSQGSEWRKVFLLMHQSHNTMIQRELLYTACTRAKEMLYVICEPDSFMKGILGQRIRGNTLKEKAEFFKGKLERGEEDLLIKIGENK
jgi:exodeoxyribonuclease V alpha subunit